MLTLILVSCKNEPKKEEVAQPEVTEEQTQENIADKEIKSLNGEFLFDGNNAVFQMGGQMYAVELNEECKKLAERCKEFQKTKYDFSRVAVTGYIEDNPNKDGWEKQIVIYRIFYVGESQKNDNITIKSSN